MLRTLLVNVAFCSLRPPRLLALISYLLLALSPSLLPARADASEVASASAGAEGVQAEFMRQYQEWNRAMQELRQLKQQYESADLQQRATLKDEFQAKLQAVRNNVPQLKAAAIAAYRAAPNQSDEVTDFLVSSVAEDVARDDYEAAVEAIQLLQEHDDGNSLALLLGGIVAFCTNDYEGAASAFDQAEQLGAFQAPGRRERAFAELASQFRGLISEYRQHWSGERALRAAEAEADDLPRVKLTTNKGEVVVELFENEAPVATANFISLVEKGFYNGLKFHRVLPNFMAQGGCPRGTGSGGPGYNIPCECQQPNHRKHFRGTLSMAHAGRDTGGSQFFLTFVPTDHLNGKHTAFGRVIEGFDVLARLQRRAPDSGLPADVIERAEVLRKRPHAYVPKKVGG